MSGAEGALVGLIVAVIIVVVVRAFYHGQMVTHGYRTTALANAVAQQQLRMIANPPPAKKPVQRCNTREARVQRLAEKVRGEGRGGGAAWKGTWRLPRPPPI